jgi:hypothetical protein
MSTVTTSQTNNTNNTKNSVKESELEDLLTSEYISQMNSKERIAYQIAKEHLGTSFNLKKSIGYKEWLKNKEKSIP